MTKFPWNKLGPSLLLLTLIVSLARAQAPQTLNAAELQLALNKLNVLGSALYIAAHPDDENTRLIAFLSNEKLINTAYLSLTRGDGGQNLIGPEIGPALGLIRTWELLEARKIDGGRQYFTRAIDFGFSKHADETFNIWDREAVLSDIVWVIRNFKPDVVITRFNTEPGTTHGQHTASAILAEEAFNAAADRNKFPEQLKFAEPWQPKRLFWNTSSFFFENEKFDTTGLINVNVGRYNALLGKSYTELAAESRTMHKSQGFGASGARGDAKDYLKPLIGDPDPKELFQGINTSWSRIKGGEKVSKLFQQAAQNFQPENPSAILPILLEANTALKALPDGYWKNVKSEELQKIMEACLGLYLEVVAQDYSVVPGDSLALRIEAINRSSFPVTLQKISYSKPGEDSLIQTTLKNNELQTFKKKFVVPQGLPYSHPYWLEKEGSKGMYHVDELKLIGNPANDPAMEATFSLLINKQIINITRPIVYKRTDPVAGEQYRPLEIIPSVFVNLTAGVLMFPSIEPKDVEVIVRAGKADVQGTVNLKLPDEWKAEPQNIPVNLQKKGEEIVLHFKVYPPANDHTAELTAEVELNRQTFSRGYFPINYTHIPNQLLLPEATANITRFDVQKRGDRIGYIMGAGDEIPESLRQIGYQVTLLNEKDLTLSNLQNYDAVIMGVRAYNTAEKLKFYQSTLFEYVKQGGNMIVQYNTTGGLFTTDLAPYPLKLSRDRVAVEEAPVRILKPEHPVVNYPNKITQDDFENWVQERGLYFPAEWDDEFEPILSINDPGEDPKDGSLLVAKYGKGHYIYTGLSFFRQLPAGVPGAYRVFANLISLGKELEDEINDR
ncbi:PIG-L family deacetylase [soil metagenome]